MSSEIKKRKNKKQQQQQNDNESKKLTKDEEAVAKYLKFNCQTRKANLMGMKVDYFIGSKAVDCLMSSKWATGVKNTPILFQNRDSCKHFLQELLNKELFHRSAKVFKEQQIEASSIPSASSKAIESTTPENTPKVRKRKGAAAIEATAAEADKSKRKFKLEMHDEQIFLDSNDPYVWIYDPATAKSLIVGSLLVIGAIGVCLFPLWPSIVRDGVYYLSVGGAGFLGSVLSLAVFKYILFAIIWICTLGNVHFWLLPNLTEDVGFFESFMPLYKLKNISSPTSSEKNKTKAVEAELKEKEDTVASREKKSEEFNNLPLNEQLMKKFDENIDDDENEADVDVVAEEEDEEEKISNNNNNYKNDDHDDVDDYDVIEKDIDLKNN